MPNYGDTGQHVKCLMTICGKYYCVFPVSTPEQKFVFLKNQPQVLQTRLKQVKAGIKKVKTTMEVCHART